MEKLYSVQDIMERYQITAQTARKYMHRMVHMEKPLMVSEASLRAFEAGQTVSPGENHLKATAKQKVKANSIRKNKSIPQKSGARGPYYFERRRA